MLHKFLNDFLALAPLQLPELINQERMEQPVYEDGYVLLDIDRSAKILMRKDAGFKKRLASNALTMADVERLFMEVTYGIIELELFEGY